MAIFFQILVLSLTFIGVSGGVIYLQRAVGSRIAVNRRLGGAAATESRQVVSTVIRDDNVSNRFLAWVQTTTALNRSEDGGKLRKDLASAGFSHPSAPVWYVICRFSLAIGLPLLLIVSLIVIKKPLAGLGGIIFPLALCGLGMIMPKAFLDNRIGARRGGLENQFPDALDLMVVCVEAGLGLEAAFIRVAHEVRESHPRIAEEFGRLADELGAGRGRADALRSLADRVGVDSVKSFVALLIQTDALGVSIAQSLRTYSAEMRETRYLNAEEKAMRIPVLLTLPIVGCFMPVIVVALLLPSMIDMTRNLGPALRGHGPAQATSHR